MHPALKELNSSISALTQKLATCKTSEEHEENLDATFMWLFIVVFGINTVICALWVKRARKCTAKSAEPETTQLLVSLFCIKYQIVML